MADDRISESYDFLQRLVGRFAELITNLADDFGDPAVAELMMEDLGLDPDSSAQLEIPQQNTASIDAYLARTDPDLEAFLSAIDDIVAVIEAIVSFIELASAEPTTEDGLREMAYELLVLSNLHTYRYRYPAAVGLAEVLGILNWGLEDYQLPSLLFARAGDLLDTLVQAIPDGPIGFLNKPARLADEDDARQHSDSLLILLALLALWRPGPRRTLELLDFEKPRSSRADTELLYGWDILDIDAPTRAETISNRMLSVRLTFGYTPEGQTLFDAPTGPGVGDVDHLGEVDRDLDNRLVHPELAQKFADEGRPIDGSAVVVKKLLQRWHIVADQTYLIEREADVLKVRLRPADVKLETNVGIVLVPEDDGGPALLLALGGGGKMTIPLTTDWTLAYDGKTTTAVSMLLNLAAKDVELFGPAGGGLSMLFSRNDKYLERRAAIPKFAGNDLSFGGLALGVEATGGRLEFKATSTDNILILSSDSADSFIRKSLPGGEIRAEFGIGLAYDVVDNKLRFTEGTRLKVVLPMAKSFLGIELVYLTVEIAPTKEGDAARLELSASISVRWGAFTTVIDRIGLELLLPPPKDATGDLQWDQALTFKAPSGIGFAIDASPAISGGGFLFFDRDRGEYAGVLNLAIGGVFDLKIIGLISTDVPGRPDEFSMIAIGSIESDSGIGLPLGFTLNGAGILVGLNRSMVVNALRSGVRTGTIDNLLFPDDPVVNAPKIINDLGTVFPLTAGRNVFGGLLLLSWAGQRNSFTLKVGVAVETPEPRKLAILGQLDVALPRKALDIVRIKADFVGVWDQAAKTFSVDAALRDSKVGRFPLTGELAARSSWGRDKVFIVAAGGVHPAFDPPDQLPSLRPLQIAVGSSDNPRLRLQGYLAITSNTIQAGGRAELHARKSGFTLEGWVGVDALFDVSSYTIAVDFSAGVEIRRGSRVLFSLTLKATLEAFSPIRIQGKVKFKICWVSFSIPVRLTLGNPVEVVIPAADVLDDLLTALNDRRNWGAELPEGRAALVTLREPPVGDELLVSPVAALSVKQQVVPLDTEIQLYNNARPKAGTSFSIGATPTLNGTPIARRDEHEYFAPAQYLEMSDDEKLASPSFERMPAGVGLGDDSQVHGARIARELTYETIKIDKGQDRFVVLPDYTLNQEVFEAVAAFGAAAEAPTETTGPTKYRGRTLGIKLSEPEYVVAGLDDLVAVEGSRGTYTQAVAALRAQEAAAPGLTGRLQVVGANEGRQG